MPLPLDGVMHVNVNCASLERSLPFYRDLLGLSPLSHTKPVPQDGAGFGLEGRVAWDAHLLHDHRGLAGPAVDLLAWQTPAPCGAPPADPHALGFARLGIRAADLDERAAALRAGGVVPLAAPTELPVDATPGRSARRLCARDPDGTTIEWTEGAGPTELRQVTIQCSDVARSGAWYASVLGLEETGASRNGPVDGAPFGASGRVRWEARVLAVPGQRERFAIDLVEWTQPRPVGEPARRANQLGMFRMAFLVEDAQACTASLRAEGVDCNGPVWLDMGPEIPIAGLWASFFRDPDGTCLELIQRPELGG